MTSSPAATDAARRLWARAAKGATEPKEAVLAAERLFTQLRLKLGRWIGADGYRALLDRAFLIVRAEHPALDDLSSLQGDQPVSMVVKRAHSPTVVGAGLVALVAELIELLGRIIGEEMAVRLVEQTGIQGPSDVISTKPKGGRDG